jgi:peptide/nickel transport system substrate-binding protein
METTYRLRPATWHDGQPFTAEDVIFTWQTIMRPELPAATRIPEQYVDSMEALDPQTVLVGWKSLYIYANVYEQDPLPRHIFTPVLERGDPQTFVNSDYWRSNWTGLGPYQLVDWVRGSHLRGRAFAPYVLGAPRISEVLVYFIPDANQAMARMLAGELDLTVGSLLKAEEGMLLKDRLSGEGDIAVMKAGFRSGDFQLRQTGLPQLRDLRVRQGIAHSVDRQELVDVLWFGLTTTADMFLPPESSAFAAADRAITRYPYDPNRALRLFEEAGWTRGADGLLQNAAGERFHLGLRSLDRADYVKETQIIEQSLQRVGIRAEIEFYTRAMQNDREYRAKFPGIAFGGGAGSLTGKISLVGYATDSIPSESNRWAGSNRGGYSNTAVDDLIARYDVTVDAARRDALLVDLLKIITGDLAVLPMYYVLDVYGIRSGLKEATPSRPGEAWTTANAHLMYWER